MIKTLKILVVKIFLSFFCFVVLYNIGSKILILHSNILFIT